MKGMSMFKKIYFLSVIGLAISFVIAFSSIEALSQKGGKGRYRKVSLTKGAKKNGYTVTQHGRNEYFLQIFGAEDPLTKKRVEGEKEVEFKCKEPSLSKVPYIHRLFFSNGNTQPKKIECLLLVSPRIIILEEDN
jgi:hypothetical protein